MYNQKTFSRPCITELPDNDEVPKDPAMENVFKWSLARNIPALDFPDDGFERTRKRDSIGSATSKLTDHSYQNGVNTRRPSLTNQLTAENQNVQVEYEEFVGRVPIELFTISRVVENAEDGGKSVRRSIS